MSQKVLLLQFVRQLYDKSLERHGEENAETLTLFQYMESLEAEIRKSQSEPQSRIRHRSGSGTYPLARSAAFAGNHFAEAGIWITR